MKLPTPMPRIFVGQRWRNKKDDNIIEITALHNDFVNTKNAYGGGKCHHIRKKDLVIYWEPTRL